MGINIGALLAPLVCGTIGELYGWHYGFSLAGVGMLAGLLVFRIGENKLGEKGLPLHPEKLSQKVFPGINRNQMVVLCSFLSVKEVHYVT